MQYIEVERKFALPDSAGLKAKLDELGAKPGELTRQVDAYYNAPHKDFLAPQAIATTGPCGCGTSPTRPTPHP